MVGSSKKSGKKVFYIKAFKIVPYWPALQDASVEPRGGAGL